MHSAIFIRTYWKDLDWLQLCLRSVERYCSGFSEVVVMLPQASRPWLERSPLPSWVRAAFGPSYPDDYLGQQVSKLEADLVVDADWIVHLDADCIVTLPTRPDDLLPAGRPCIVTKPIAALGRHYPWREPTERFLGFGVNLDFMQQPPFVFPRWLYAEVRQHGERLHGMPIDRYVLVQPRRGFSEFNVLGAFAWRRHREAFDFAAACSTTAPEPRCDWHWSWGGLTPEIRVRIESALSERAAGGMKR